jgi:predicted ATPase/class 3 adenylate cyclase
MPSQDAERPNIAATRPVAPALTEAAHGERRILTALCYDLVGSTQLLEALGIEDYQDVMSAFHEDMRRIIDANGGEIKEEAGDGGLVLFPTDLDPKDAASLAIRAGFEIVSGCGRLARKLKRERFHVRIGIATSVFILPRAQGTGIPKNIAGTALAMATRLQTLAEPDAIYVSQETRSLVRRSYVFADLGSQQLKGFSAPQNVWRAVRQRREIDRFFAFGRLSGPMVNRSADLALVLDIWKQVVKGRGQFLLVEGVPGIGKSRFVHKIRTATRDNRGRLLLFQCQPAGTRATLHPLMQRLTSFENEGSQSLRPSAVSRQFREQGIGDAEAIRIFSFLLGLKVPDQSLTDADPDQIRQKTHWAVKRCLEQLCTAGPLLVVVEDAHWIDPTTRQILGDVSKEIAAFPVFVVLTSRLGEDMSWIEPNSLSKLTLARLGADGVQEAVRHHFPAATPAELAAMLDLIARVSGGVPLLIEEMCQWAAENFDVAKEALSKGAGGGQNAALESVIESRLSALGPAGEIARAASVMGERFDDDLVTELVPGRDPRAVAEALERLVRAGFLAQLRPVGAPLYGFRHALVRETIYNALLNKRKRALHESLFKALQRNRELAPWIGAPALADHAERAGLIDDAIAQFTLAGEESAARSALVEARQLLEHALELAEQLDDEDSQDRAKLSAMTALGPVLTSAEGPSSAPARKLYDDGIEIARRRPAEERATWFPIYWGWWFTDYEMNGARAHVLLNELKNVDDPEVQLQTRHCVWAIDFYLGNHKSCIEQVDAGLPLYGLNANSKFSMRYGNHDTKACGLAHRGLSLWFSGQPSKAVEMLAEAKAWARESGHSGSMAHAFVNGAMLDCFRRDFDSLLTDVAEMRNLVQAHGIAMLAGAADILEGWCIGVADDPERGHDMIEQGLEQQKALQTLEDYPVYCGLLAEILVKKGSFAKGLNLLQSALEEARERGHLYWVAELYRRKAQLELLSGRPDSEVTQSLATSLEIAASQGAVPILLAAYNSLVASNMAPDLAARYALTVSDAKHKIPDGESLYVNPEAVWLSRHGS